MTPEWFDDLAERLSAASLFAYEDCEFSMAREFQLAREDAIDYAYSARKAIEEMKARAQPPEAIEPVRRTAHRRQPAKRVA